MPAGRVNVVIDRISRVDHQAIDKLHGLGPLTSQLAADNNLIRRNLNGHLINSGSITSQPLAPDSMMNLRTP